MLMLWEERMMRKGTVGGGGGRENEEWNMWKEKERAKQIKEEEICKFVDLDII